MDFPKMAAPKHSVHSLVAGRWSPYAFDDRAVSDDDIKCLFEAARLSASSYNEQPWRYLVATKANTSDYDRLLSCLTEANQVWAQTAPVLAVGCASLNFTLNGKTNTAAEHDLGAASATLALEATARGLCVHQMIGILPDKARELYRIPDNFRPLTGLAIGYSGDPGKLPVPLRDRDFARRTRRPLAEFVYIGQWGTALDFAK